MKVTLDAEDRLHLANLMDHWVASVDEPDEPLLGFADSSELFSPRDLVRAVQEKTEIGERYLHDLAEVVARAALEDVTRKRFG